MLSLLFIIIGHTAYGVTNTLWKNPRQELGTLPLIISRSFSCFIIFISSYFFLDCLRIVPKKSFQNSDLLKTFGICAINFFGLFFYLESLKHTQVSNSIGFSKIGLIIGITIGYFVYNEKVSLSKIAFCIIIFFSISIIEKAVKSEKEKISKGLIYTSMSRILWASAFLFIPFIEKLGALLFCSVLELTVCMMSLLLLFIKGQHLTIKKPSPKTQKEFSFLILLETIGTFSLNFALVKTSVIVFAFMGLIEPVIGLVISKLYHREEINKLQFIGISLGLACAFVLSFI